MPVKPTNPEEPSLATVDIESLLKNAPPLLVVRGRSYYQQRRVTIISAEDNKAKVTVRGSRWEPYELTIWLDPDMPERLIHADCDCPYAEDNHRVWCKHKVAAFLALQDHYLALRPPHWSEILQPAAQKRPAKREAKSILFFSLVEGAGKCTITPYMVPSDDFDEATLADNEKIAKAIIRGKLSKLPRELDSQRSLSRVLNASPGELAAARMLGERWRYYAWDTSLNDLLPLLTQSIVIYGSYSQTFTNRVTVLTQPARMEVQIRKEDDIRLSATLSVGEQTLPVKAGQVRIINREPVWVMADSLVFPVDENIDLIETFAGNREIVIPQEEAERFFGEFLPAIAERVPVTGDGFAEQRDVRIKPVPRVYLKEEDGSLVVELKFGYETIELPYSRDLPPRSLRWDDADSSLVTIHRDSAAEEEFRSKLSSCGLKRGQSDEAFLLRHNVSVVDFLIHYIPKLTGAGYEVYGEENLSSVRVNRARPTLSLSVSSGIDWFDVNAVVSFDDLEVSLNEIRRAVRKREKFVKLADGSIGAIPEDWAERYKHLFDLAEVSEDGLRLSKSQAMLLDAALAEADSASMDEEFERRLAQLKDFSTIEPRPLPSGFVGELRHYQKVGYDWLHFLHDYQFGGCLADDMGIGKTVQTLVFLQSLHESGHTNSANLIVMPRSLLSNWQREAARFTPSMKVLIHADLDRGRDISEFDNYDLILTTYGIMLRDIDILRNYRFHYAVLDESQAVKNPLCHTSRAARLINSEQKLVLTGTPVENSTVELWSQFAFLNPGMLGSLDYFRREFASPIERRQDQEAAKALRQLVYPFILRRTKELVAPELPLKTERIIYCDMDPSQRKVYDLQRDKYRALLLGMIEQSGMNSARMKVLEGLLRLRQICNHPKLVDKTSKSDSAKMEVLIETLETLQAEGHKALVFSQFTQMLRLLRAELDKREVPYLYLDGHTQNRQELVDRFQAEADMPFFLISLKAGGVGLNLTAADYVIHIDPWWNPAVERQASDRTHRIGQENPVFVHKLISRDTVEEKMLELQDRKRDLVDKLITTESSFFKSLTADDVRELFS